jgi:Phage Terminase
MAFDLPIQERRDLTGRFVVVAPGRRTSLRTTTWCHPCAGSRPTGWLLPRWQEEGIPAFEVRQTLATLTAPAKEFERLLMAHLLRHTGSPVMRWMVANVIVTMDAAGNIMPNKEKSGNKIDGVSAAIVALERALVYAGPSVYDERPPLLVDL